MGGSVPCGTERQAVPRAIKADIIARTENKFLLHPLALPRCTLGPGRGGEAG